MSVRDLIIVGAGPSGLSAAIAAKQRGLDYQVIERGVLVNSIYNFPPQMIFFTTPELLEIGGLPFVSPYEKPTRAEALIYYRKVVDKYDLQITLEEEVLSVEREDGHQPQRSSAVDRETLFAVETRSSRGVRRVRHARHVLFAIGYYDHPVMIRVPGEDLPHVSHYYKEPHPYYRQRVVVVGGGNSAAEWSLELYRTGAFVTLVHRWPELKRTIKYWVRPDIENRIKEGSIAARFNACVKEIRPTSVIITGASPPSDTERGWGATDIERGRGPASGEEELPADAVFLLTGYRADVDLMCRAGIMLTERQGPQYDPETFETNVPGLFVAGGALAGDETGLVFIENGRFHGEKIVEVVARRSAGPAA
jgi:thioredoxin reductase (NADPH)